MEIINTDGTSTSKYLIVNDIMDERFGQLTVRNVVFEDRGTYACEVANEFGTASARAILTVQGMQKCRHQFINLLTCTVWVK